MVQVIDRGIYLFKGREIVEDTPENQGALQKRAPAGKALRRGTMAYRILAAHHEGSGEERTAAGPAPLSGEEGQLHLRFDAMASHDITFVNIVQTAKVSGLEQFPIPYILTNCHNSLCAVGGTINEDDHLFGLSAAQKYGGIYVPPHLGVIHSYIRETQAGCGKMILGSDSHTRYGALGTMGVGEGGGELVKQLLRQTYDMAYPRIIAVYLTGKPPAGVGPQDAALGIIGAVFKRGFVKNAVLEFLGEGIAALSAEYRSGIDVMTTETACWSSIWETDEVIRDYLELHGRGGDYARLGPEEAAYYDGLIRVDLSSIKPMIALPFHPSNVYEIDTLRNKPGDILRQVELDAGALTENPHIRLMLTDKVDDRGRLRVDQGIIAGCAGGTFDNIMAAAAILGGPEEKSSPGYTGNEGFSLSIYPGSQPVLLELAKNGTLGGLIAAGVLVRTAFCGPCFGAGDVPANNGLSIRHTTRNFPHREGSKPMNGQISSVCLMDARSIAATARNGGYLTSALGMEAEIPAYHYDDSPYRSRVYQGAGRPRRETELRYGPNITDWPPIEALGENLLVKLVSFISDPVTTTDEIIPSGETSSFRSNPVGLAEFTLSRKDPDYVGRAKALRGAARILREAGAAKTAQKGPEETRRPSPPAEGGVEAILPELSGTLEKIRALRGFEGLDFSDIQIASAIFAVKPGDGSAREQAASCQRVLGGAANFAREYATKRYRSNLINWGIIPFIVEGEPPFARGDYVFIPRIRGICEKNPAPLAAYIIGDRGVSPLELKPPELSPMEGEIIREGCLINYNRRRLSESGAVS
jgi:aconitate hydratase